MHTLSARCAVRPVQHSRPVRRHAFAPAALLGSLFGKEGGTDGASRTGWVPGAADTLRKVSKAGHDITPVTAEQRSELAKGLTPMEKYIALEHGTEQPFTGETSNGFSHDNKQKGVYVCALGGLPLFTSDTKYNSGTGWPSFWEPIDPDHIVEVLDTSIPNRPRIEVLDARTGAHLGHVFNDGPRPTGRRYCINAAALRFIPEGEPLPQESKPVQ